MLRKAANITENQAWQPLTRLPVIFLVIMC